MRVKKIGAILAGAVMIGSAVVAAWSPADNKGTGNYRGRQNET